MSTSKQGFESKSITRREFLRIGGIGFSLALGLFMPSTKYLARLTNSNSPSIEIPKGFLSEINTIEALSPNQQGRVLSDSISVYNIPSYSGTKVKNYWRDSVILITEITIGKSEDSFNTVWYKVSDEGYVHSGEIQPVFTITNPVVSEIPSEGALAEVTVPFTDAHWDPGKDEPVTYRYYYATAYWVMKLVQDSYGNPWYEVLDDKWDYTYFVPAQHLRFIPAEELKPISPDVPSRMKRIEVHIPEQVMIAFEYDQPVFMARIASGAVFSSGDYSTPLGKFMTNHKLASRHMARDNLAANGYDLPGVPWNSYITEEGIAFHGTYWHNNFGKPRSHGCINLTPQAAKWVYLWTLPNVPPDQEGIYKQTGTSVEIIG